MNKMLPREDLPAYCFLKIIVMQRIVMAFYIESPLWTRSQGTGCRAHA